jgi:homoserine O-acetyltransferase
LGSISAPVLWIKSSDVFINPPEHGIEEILVTRMPHAKFLLIPVSDATRGHGTHTQAAVWKDDLVEFLRATARAPN